MSKIIECIPNFSEGQNQNTIDAIANAISSVHGITLKCVDAGLYAHRSVFTFLGNTDAVLNAAYLSIKTAAQFIDMRHHRGTHPRIGAIDVVPFVSLEEENFELLNKQVLVLAEKISIDFGIHTFLYELTARENYRKNLATIRKGQYENLAPKMKQEKWYPDFGPADFNPILGGTVIGVRNLLVAFNVNIDTKDTSIAVKIAEELRESGRWVVHKDGTKEQIFGFCKGVKALGWYIQDFDQVQVSMNIVDISQTPVHIAFETCRTIASRYGVQVTGSELIGCIPKKCLVDAGNYFYQKESNSESPIEEKELISKAVSSLGLQSLKPFDLDKNVLDYYPMGSQ